MPQTVEQAVQSADAIFEARVASITPEGERRLRVQMDVVQSWRGADAEHVEVLTAAQSAECGYPFEVGRSYLVYAQRSQTGALSTGLCSRTRPVQEADEDRRALGSGTVPVEIADEPLEPEPRPRGQLGPGAGCAGCGLGCSRHAGAAAAAILAALALARRRRR